MRRTTTARTLAACTTLALGACAHLTPLQPLRPRVDAPVIVPVSATDVQYFDANPLMVPVEGIRPDKVRDTFNEARDDGGRIHRATDILAPRGTPVLAATSGKILRMSQNALGGITIYLLDDNTRFLEYYAHLDHYSDLISTGVHVLQGDVLGYVGSTGNADPEYPHLHFQVMRWEPGRRDYWNGAAVDVRPFFSITGQGRVANEGTRAGRASR